MKRFRLVAIIIGVMVSSIVIFSRVQRGPRRLAELHVGIDIPRSYKLLEFEDDWHINGDGKTLIIYSLTDVQLHELESKLMMRKYNSLPIMEELADNFIYNYLDRQLSDGLYQLIIEGQDEHDYSLIVLDQKNRILLIYYVIT